MQSDKHNILFTSEAVSEGHPDKIADQISDAIVDSFLVKDPNAKVACETLVTTGQVIIAGEFRSEATVDVQKVARGVIKSIGYDRSELMFDADSCGILNAMHGQSEDIQRGVEQEKQGAGDQGMMFGYATNETPEYMPLPLYLANLILLRLRYYLWNEECIMPYLRPDAKSQVTVEYSPEGKPLRVHTIVVSTQHDDFFADTDMSVEDQERNMQMHIRHDIESIVIPSVIRFLPKELRKLFDDDLILHVNPTGKFVIGGPHGDTGLTGRKIIADTYGGRGAHGGGAFSGKDPSKVDRSAAYAARHIAKNLVAAGVADEVLVQLAYAIGIAEPVSINVNTYGKSHVEMSDGEIAEIISREIDLTPAGIIERLKLLNPIYEATASYGHFGKPSVVADYLGYEGKKKRNVEFDTWEKLDMVDKFKELFNIKTR